MPGAWPEARSPGTVEGDTIAAIGSAGPTDHADAVEIDGCGFAVLPGFVDIHAHPSSEPMLKGLTDEVGSRQLYMSSLYESCRCSMPIPRAGGLRPRSRCAN